MSETTAKTKSVKKRARNSKADKYCNSCNQNITENKKRDTFMKQDTYHQLQVKNYCEEHERTHSDHDCTPIWCDDCRYLIKYQVKVNWDKKKRQW